MEVAASIIGAIHIIGMSVWIGGTIFHHWVLTPAAKGLEPPQAGILNAAMGQRWTQVIWTAIILTIVTGIIRAIGVGAFDPDVLVTSYGTILLIKIALVIVAVIFGIMTTASAIKTGKLAESGAAPPEIGAQMNRTMMIAKTNLFVGVIIVTLAVGMRVVEGFTLPG